MTLKEKVNYFTDDLYNRQLVDYYNQTINNYRKDGFSEEVIKPYIELRDTYIIQHHIRLEKLQKELFA